MLTSIRIPEGAITDISGGWKTPIVGGGWTSTRGQFRTPENAAFAWVGYIFYQEDGLNGDVYLDNVSLEEGDGRLGRVLFRTDAAGNVTTYAYNPVPNTTDTEVWTTDPKPGVGTSKSTYNVKNQITKNIDGAGRTSTYTYDAMGFRQAVLDPAGRTTVFTNDGRGNTKIVDRTWLATGGKEYFNFAPGTSNLVEYRDARSSSATDNAYRTTFGYSAANTNLRTSQTDPAGQTKLWTYTDGSEQAVNGVVGQKQPKGLLKTMTDRTAVTTQFFYGVTGDLITKSDPASGVQVTAYDEIGRPISVTHQAAGAIPAATTTLVYDVRSHMIRSTGPAILNVVTNVNHQLQVETIYDNNGNPTQVQLKDLLGGDPTRTMITQYDDLDRPVTITQPRSKVTTMGYDEDGNVVATTGPRGLTVTSTFDDRGLPLVATATNYADSVGGAPRAVVLSSNTYDVLGRPVTSTDSIGRVAETQYWPDDRVRQVLRKNFRNRDGSVRDVVLLYQEYDAVGNVVLSRKGDAAHGSVSVAHSYDANGFVVLRV